METRRAFVLMPFEDPYNSYYSSIFRPALEEASYDVSRADDLFAPRPIIASIQDSIVEADLILCEMSGRNPNVFYELGLAHAIGKPAILVSCNKKYIPFDLQHIRVIIYDCTLAGWEEKLRDSITRAAIAVKNSGKRWPLPLASESIRRKGLLEVFRERAEAESPPAESLKGLFASDFLSHSAPSVEDIDMIGIALEPIVDTFSEDSNQKQWVDKVIGGCNIRILILKPGGEETKIRQEHEKDQLSTRVGTINVCKVRKMVGGILRKIEEQSTGKDKDKIGSFKFGFYDIVPSCCVHRVGRKMLVTNYLYAIVGNMCPTFILEEKDEEQLFEKYMTHFEHVWNSDRAWVYELRNRNPELVLARDTN